MRNFFHGHDSVRGWATPHPTRRYYPPMCPTASTRWTVSRRTYWSCPRIQGASWRSITKASQNHHRGRKCSEFSIGEGGSRDRKRVSPTRPSERPCVFVKLALPTANLNARIRSCSPSSREMWTQPDQFSNQQIPLHDQKIIVKQNEHRMADHTHGEKAKAPISTPATQEIPDVNLPTERYEPCEDTHPDPVLNSPTTGNDSDTCPSHRRSTRVQRRPARYDDFVMKCNWVMDTMNSN